MIRRRSATILPESIDWSQRFNPAKAAMDAQGPYYTHPLGYLKAVDKLARENGHYMRQKFAAQGGRVIGYHGTTTPNALMIMNSGFHDARNEEGGYGVSAWDEVAGLEAARYALRRSKEAGESDEGKILKVEMRDPLYDSKYGRLEWFSAAANVIALEMLTPEELGIRFGKPIVRDVQLNLSSVS